jgi:hypothetical protein
MRRRIHVRRRIHASEGARVLRQTLGADTGLEFESLHSSERLNTLLDHERCWHHIARPERESEREREREREREK